MHRKTKENRTTTPRKKSKTKRTFRTQSKNLSWKRKTLLSQGRRERGQHLIKEDKGDEAVRQQRRERVTWNRTNLLNELREGGKKVSMTKRDSRRTSRYVLDRSRLIVLLSISIGNHMISSAIWDKSARVNNKIARVRTYPKLHEEIM